VRVVVINDSSVRRLTIAVRPAQPAATATLERLIAPGLTATGGVTIGGQSFGSATTTAMLQGRASVSALRPLQGRYVVELPPASAALLTLTAA
jgi:hypothetical protein